jgi:hypothetical protein
MAYVGIHELHSTPIGVSVGHIVLLLGGLLPMLRGERPTVLLGLAEFDLPLDVLLGEVLNLRVVSPVQNFLDGGERDRIGCIRVLDEFFQAHQGGCDELFEEYPVGGFTARGSLCGAVQAADGCTGDGRGAARVSGLRVRRAEPSSLCVFPHEYNLRHNRLHGVNELRGVQSPDLSVGHMFTFVATIDGSVGRRPQRSDDPVRL